MKRMQIQQKFKYETFYIHEKILFKRNCRHKFIKDLLKNAKKTRKPNNYDLNHD